MITPRQHSLLIAQHDKTAGKFANYHPVQNAGDQQLMLVGHNWLNVSVIMLVALDNRFGFSHCVSLNLVILISRPVVTGMDRCKGRATDHPMPHLTLHPTQRVWLEGHR
jgi:hypothetical protein